MALNTVDQAVLTVATSGLVAALSQAPQLAKDWSEWNETQRSNVVVIFVAVIIIALLIIHHKGRKAVE